MNLSKLRTHFYRIAEGGERRMRKRTRFFNGIVVVFILVDILAMVLETVPDLEARYALSFRYLELTALGVFSVEYFIRIWVCVEDRRVQYQHPVKGRIRYALSPIALIDLMAVLPFYTALFFGVSLMGMRVFRLLKLLRYSSALSLLSHAIKSERKVLGSAAIVMFILLMSLSTIMYFLEREVQPDTFGTMPDALWWGVVTLTTVGYGDVVPHTVVGRIVGALATMTGLGMFALPAGILATAFAQEAKKKNFVVTWRLVANVPLFNQLDAAHIADISSLLSPVMAFDGERIIKKGEKADCMYFIVHGEVCVLRDKQTITLKDGNFFGEIALLENNRERTASVIAKANCQLLILEKNDFEKLVKSQPKIKEILRDVARQRLGIERSQFDATTPAKSTTT